MTPGFPKSMASQPRRTSHGAVVCSNNSKPTSQLLYFRICTVPQSLLVCARTGNPTEFVPCLNRAFIVCPSLADKPGQDPGFVSQWFAHRRLRVRLSMYDFPCTISHSFTRGDFKVCSQPQRQFVQLRVSHGQESESRVFGFRNSESPTA
jgi:hypothetical protein